MIWSIIYLAAVLTANYTAVWFVPFPTFGMVAIGTLIFGVTFTARDYVHRLGRSRVYLMITVSALASSVLSLFGPVDWRVITASIVAIMLSETADTEIYQKMLDKRWLLRVTSSNAISIPLDTLLFNSIAFLGVFTLPVLVSIMFGEIVVKFSVGIVVALWRLI